MITLTLSGLVHTIFFLLIAAGVVALLFYLISICPIPEPYKGWIFLVLKILVVVFAICFLLGLAGLPIIRFA